MTLKSLKDTHGIDGFGIKHYNITDESIPKFVSIDHRENSITFKFQKGTVKENGVNGCAIETLVEVAKELVIKENNEEPSQFNRDAIQGLEAAKFALSDRRTASIKQGTN